MKFGVAGINALGSSAWPGALVSMTILVVALIALVVISRDALARSLPEHVGALRAVWPLLVACALVPLGADEIVAGARRIGLAGPGEAMPVRFTVLTVMLVAVSLTARRTVRRIDETRGEALEKVKASEQRLRLHIERMPIAYMTISPDLVVTSWNPAAERIFGYSEAEIVGRSAAVLVPGGMTAAIASLWKKLAAGDRAVTSINENVTKQGREIACRWTVTSLTGASGEFAGVLAMTEDISDEQMMQAELHRTEERTRRLLDSVPHAIFSVDANDRFTAVNAATCRFFGRPEEELLGRTAADLGISPEIAHGWAEQKAKCRAAGTAITGEITGAGDPPRSMQLILTPGHDAPETLTGIAIDRTSLKAAEAAWAQLLRAVEQLDEVMFTTDREGVITYVNPAFEKVYGHKRSEVIGSTPRILKSGEVSLKQYESLWAALLSGQSVQSEYRNRRKDGTLIDVIGSAAPVVQNGEVTGFIAVQRDVTEQKRTAEERQRLEERLARIAKMDALAMLAGGIAHDFNNILAIILTHTTLIERKPKDPELVLRVASTLKLAVERGASLSRQILTFARRDDLAVERVDIAKVIPELRSMIAETFPRNVRFTFDIAPGLPPINADSGQLHQALLNLCVNSRDAMPSGGELKIEAQRIPASAMRALFDEGHASEHLCISVSDTGCGMTPETRRHLFEPFFTTKEKGKGTGLGLSVVYGVVKSHRGLVEVDSKPAGGTVFRLYFPVAAMPSPPSKHEPATATAGKETLLVIDDEPMLVDPLGIHLRRNGYQVVLASDGPDAIAKCRSMAPLPDAIVMDLSMPKMSSRDLVLSLREISPEIPIIAMTGYLDSDDHAEAVCPGIQRTILKPFAPDDLLRTIRSVLDSRAS